ncbi:MAG: 3-phosphoglycerate dehydrogenase [Clostridiales bacterium]|jgi:D-3-phosphoglycerate dehydrogenase|nr:3-phosphoglycerate dehydrogenase [Clostridiales bacterium]
MRVKVMDEVSQAGLSVLDFNKLECVDKNGDGIIVRSGTVSAGELTPDLLAIARVGVGVDNIPMKECTEAGIVVFITPNGNANAVKELVISALLLSSRDIIGAANWVQTLKDNVENRTKDGRFDFIGPEISGKTLGVIGLGDIGVLVANSAHDLGMNVMGYDPFISVKAAWKLTRTVNLTNSFDEILQNCDYISLHLPLNESTRGMIDEKSFKSMKDGVRLINYARGEIVEEDALLNALKSGKLAKYVTDFADEGLLGNDNIIITPHLGSVTPESEEKCASMAAMQLADYLKNGNIANSANFPECVMDRVGGTRIIILDMDIPNMIGQFSNILGKNGYNIIKMASNGKDGYGCTIADIEGDRNKLTDTVREIAAIDGVIRVRIV